MAASKLSDVERVGTDGVGTGAKHVRSGYPACKCMGPTTGVWYQSSPYIEDPNIDAPEDGGPDVIYKGREPWRGR